MGRGVPVALGIPSSVRTEPSNVVKDFIGSVPPNRSTPLCAIDIGCGSGRNSLFLAEQGFNVVAMDFAPLAIEKLRQAAERLGVADQVTAVCQDVSTHWPVPDTAVDLAIDTFCFKHQIQETALQTYVMEATRTLKVGGRFLLFLAAKEDSYYSQFLTSDQHGPGIIIRDPGNNILSRLYDYQEIAAMFEGLAVERYALKRSENVMTVLPMGAPAMSSGCNASEVE